MKKLLRSANSSRHKKIACTVSAAALMLGVSSAATVGLHFQDTYCYDSRYSGFIVTYTAFGVVTNNWENLTPMYTGYGCGANNALGYTLSETVDTTTSSDGLNPLPNGSLNVNWFGPTANFSGFAGYAGKPPSYEYDGPPPKPIPNGEQQIYSTFLRDGFNFGPGSTGGTNTQPGYSVDVTGLKSLFTNSSFVVELIAAADSMQKLTNAYVVDVVNSLTNSVTYPNTPPVTEDEGSQPWVRGHGGGLSIYTGAINSDHIKIFSSHPLAGGNKTVGFDDSGTISGFIVTDQPVITMSPQSIAIVGAEDSVQLSAYAIGVPPLSYQWRLNGLNIPGATSLSYTSGSVNLGGAGAVTNMVAGGNYDLVVTNLYGSTTSAVASVTVDKIGLAGTNQVIYDSNPGNPQLDAIDVGATWLASSTDGHGKTENGVLSFDDTNSDGVVVSDNTRLDGPTGTITFWMRSPGTDQNSPFGSGGAALIKRAVDTSGDGFLLEQNDGSAGNLYFQFEAPNDGFVGFTTIGGVSDNLWHFVSLTFDDRASGGAAIYIDGTLDTTNSSSGSWSYVAGNPINIGNDPYQQQRDYDGLLSDMRYYSAVLSSSQIMSVYNTGGIVDTNDLQFRFNFTSAPGQGIILNWQESGAVLQSAPSLNGPWTDLPGAGSPYMIVPVQSQQFFRYRYTPQTDISNPYLM